MNNQKWTQFPKRILACSLVITLAVCPILSAGRAMAEPAISSKQSVEDAAIHSPIQYQIDVRLDEKNMSLHGSETIVYRNNSKDTLQALVFHTFADANRSKETQSGMFEKTNEEIRKNNPDKKAEDFLGGIDIKRVTTIGQSLQFTNEKQALTVELNQELKPGQSVTVQVDFDVSIPYGSQRLSYYKDIINGAHWFPVLSVYDEIKHQWDKMPYSTSFESDYYTSSDFQVHMNVPASYQVLMPGTITTQENAETGREIVSTVANNTREMVFFASPNFKVESVTREGLTVKYYYFDNEQGKKKIVDQYIDQAFKTIHFFSDKYGKYPYPEFRIVESYVEGVAVEFARVIQMRMIQGNVDVASDTVFVHEIAHQWFHSLIGNNSETESFLDEGFADFSKFYFSEKQKDVLNGFKSIQYDDISFEQVIGSSNEEVGDMANPVYYGKGSQAIYQLYRTVGEEKFDQFMKAYLKRFMYQNATIDGLLQTIEDTLGKEIRSDMEKALRQPNFVLKPEYRLSDEEKIMYMHDQFKSMYEASLAQNLNLPFETMNRIIEKALQGEPLTLVLSDQVSDVAKGQQDEMVKQMKGFFQFSGIKPEIITERQVLKGKLKKELLNSNLIVIGNPKSNGLVQAFKPGIMKRANDIGLSWRDTMNKPDIAGAYIIKHPYNQNRLMLHFFWTEDQLSDKGVQPFMSKMMEATNFTSSFYQFYVMDKRGKIVIDKKIENPLSKLFEQQ